MKMQTLSDIAKDPKYLSLIKSGDDEHYKLIVSPRNQPQEAYRLIVDGEAVGDDTQDAGDIYERFQAVEM